MVAMKNKLWGRQRLYLLLIALLLFSLVMLVLDYLGKIDLDFQANSTSIATEAQSLRAENRSGATPAPQISSTPSPSVTPTVTPTQIIVLPPEPTRIQFRAQDGRQLSGSYFPGSENPSPVIVIMHWARGDQSEWEPIASWLQGRGMLVRQPDYNDSWKSSDWFPERSLGIPLGVFTFDFRNCQQDGCQAYKPAEWLQDAQAALKTAAQLQGVDPDRVLTAGASIGGDAALDACTWFNQSGLGTCLGSFVLSPGSFLTESFPTQAAMLFNQVQDAPIYCLYGLRDDASVETCEGNPDVQNFSYGYVEDHGMELLRPGRDPDPLILLEDFIRSAVGDLP
jgi:dienelactone hydrolase